LTFNPKNKVLENNNHGERRVAGSQSLFYRPFRDTADEILFYIGRKKSLISFSFMRQ
jgi:hypothetical protein